LERIHASEQRESKNSCSWLAERIEELKLTEQREWCYKSRARELLSFEDQSCRFSVGFSKLAKRRGEPKEFLLSLACEDNKTPDASSCWKSSKKSKDSLERRAASPELQSERTWECVYMCVCALQTQSSCNEQNTLTKNSTTQSRSRWGSEL
jgi:hypothetical protein